MLIVLEDGDCFHVYPSPEATALEIEALDAEDTIRAAFDETGVPYKIHWLSSNTEGRILGLVPWVGNGQYALVPAGPADPASLAELLSSGRGVVPPEASAAIAALSMSS